MQYSSSSENYSSSLRDSPSKWGGRNDKNYAYKKSSYQYSSSGDNNLSYQSKTPTDQNVDQLDALLEDLKHERQLSTRDRELLPTNGGTSYRTLERTDPSTGTVTKTTRVIKTTKHAGAPQQSYLDDVETFNPKDYSTLQSTAKYSSLHRDEYQTKEKPSSYTLASSPSGGHYESKSKIYESNRTINNNVELLPSASTTQTVSSSTNIDKELQDIALSDGILPAPGTKVTTTVRTYTYEIPAGPGSTTSTINRNVNSNTLNSSSYKHQQHETHTTNTSQNYSQLSPSHVPQTVVYNTESYSTLNKPNERPLLTNQSYEIREHKETTTRGVSPQPRQLPVVGSPTSNPPNSSRTIVYNIHKTDNVNTVNEYPPNQPNQTRYPPHSPAHSPNYGMPGSPPGFNRYYYTETETSNTVNTLHGPPNGQGPQPAVSAPLKQLPPVSAYPAQPQNGGPGYPPNTTSYSYKYSSTSNTNTTNNRRGPGPDNYGTPSPFPVDGVEHYPPVGNANPPQRVDDLMQSFGTTTDHVDRVDIETPVRKREIETAVASPNQQHVPSVNKAGKEVYYPPGHETIMLKREEMHAGSASGGRWAKGSGMYEYESGSKSKTKTKSGGAVVPVCLPLCCAMPCTIM